MYKDCVNRCRTDWEFDTTDRDMDINMKNLVKKFCDSAYKERFDGGLAEKKETMKK